MRSTQRGFGLVEAMLALAIGLVLLTAASQLFVSAHQTWRLQGAAARMQADARLALLRMAQDIRMAGMFGCLNLQAGDFLDPSVRQIFARPLAVGPSSLSVVVAELPGYSGAPEWSVQTDCIGMAQVGKGPVKSRDSTWSFAVSRHIYQLAGTTLSFKRGGDRFQPLINHVREMHLEHVQGREGERVDIVLTLFDPAQDIEQRHELSVAIRNSTAQI